jgi:putative transcriptional regulator
MTINVKLDSMLILRNMQSRELAREIGITQSYLSNIKTGKVKGIRFDTLTRLCQVLECQPGDLLEYTEQTSHPVP